jgi:hypothetical protein
LQDTYSDLSNERPDWQKVEPMGPTISARLLDTSLKHWVTIVALARVVQADREVQTDQREQIQIQASSEEKGPQRHYTIQSRLQRRDSTLTRNGYRIPW